MGIGAGRALVENAMRTARERGATRIEVVANPEAVAFYHVSASPALSTSQRASAGPTHATHRLARPR